METMTNAALLVLPLFAAACLAGEPPVDERPSPTTPIAFEATTAADGKLHVATGGAALVTIPDTVGLAGEATSGFSVAPVGDVWPNLGAPSYLVRAEHAGVGSFEIDTNRGIASGLVHAEDIAEVDLGPADYALDGHSPVALDARRPRARLSLISATGLHLVDVTATLVDDQAETAAQTSWDALELAPTAGTHVVHVIAGSKPAETIAIEVVDHVDHVVEVTRDGLTCYHAYTGAYEVAAAFELTSPEPDASNCTRVTPR